MTRGKHGMHDAGNS